MRTQVTAPVSGQDTWMGRFTYNFNFAKIPTLAEGVPTYSKPSSAHTTRNTRAIAYDYRLSRRTDVYVVSMCDKTSGDGSATTTAAGVRHAFRVCRLQAVAMRRHPATS